MRAFEVEREVLQRLNNPDTLNEEYPQRTSDAWPTIEIEKGALKDFRSNHRKSIRADI